MSSGDQTAYSAVLYRWLHLPESEIGKWIAEYLDKDICKIIIVGAEDKETVKQKDGKTRNCVYLPLLCKTGDMRRQRLWRVINESSKELQILVLHGLSGPLRR